MRKLKPKMLIILALITFGSLLPNIGCNTQFWDVGYDSRATGDGNGGVIVLYDIIKSSSQRDFYAQRISADGQALWGERGVLVGSGHKPSSFFELSIAGDSTGGAIVTLATSAPSQPDRVDVTKLDSKGNIIWQKESISASPIISDGNGGVFIARDYENTLTIVQVDSEGLFPWGEDGVLIKSLGTQSHYLKIERDGAGGVIAVWQEDVELQSGTNAQKPLVEHRVLAQRIDSEGNLSWGQDNLILYTTREDVFIFEPRVVIDDSGEAIAVWAQIPEGQISDKQSSRALLSDVYVQKIDTKGNILWQENGIPLGISRLEGELVCCRLINAGSDGSGGAVIAWEEPFSVVAQRIDANGDVKWKPRGVETLRTKSGWSVRRDMVVDRLGGATITLKFRDDTLKKLGILLHKLDSAGDTVWQINDIGVDVNDMGLGAESFTSYYVNDGQGGVIVFWGIGENSSSSGKSYIQRIDSNGKLLWGAKGIRLDR